jgi:hypothetical protein
MSGTDNQQPPDLRARLIARADERVGDRPVAGLLLEAAAALDEAKRLLDAAARVLAAPGRIRDVAPTADDVDVTDWQRAYRSACETFTEGTQKC